MKLTYKRVCHSKTSPAMQNAVGGKMKTKPRVRRNSNPSYYQLMLMLMIAMANSCLNPWVYYPINQEYKKEIHKILSCSAIKCRSKVSLRGNIWGRRNTGYDAREHKKSAVSILRMRNLDQLTIST